MKVSVVIATYNRAAYLRQAIQSVFFQTMTDYEVIVVDDGSTDNTAEVAAGFGDRIRYLRTDNGGVARARNIGLSLAKGDYLCWLDSDDLFHPSKLALQSAILDRFPETGMVYSEMTAFDNDGNWHEFHLQRYHESAFGRGGVTYENLFERSIPIREIDTVSRALPAEAGWRDRRLYLGNVFDRYVIDTVVFTNSMLFRRSLFDEAGPQRPGFGFFHDLEFALRLTQRQPVCFIDVPLYALRYHPEQISTTVGPRAPWILLRKQQDLLRVLRTHGFRDRRYYESNKAAIDRQLARLCRAVAIPMLGYVQGTRHQRHYFPRRARAYLRFAAEMGRVQRFLLMLCTWLPPLPRRVVMQVERACARMRVALRT